MNITIDMGEVLTKAWKIVWKFKVLWIFGILASCASNNSGGNFNNSFGNGSGGGNGGDGEMPEFFRRFENMQPEELARAFMNEYGQYVAIFAIGLLLICLLSFLFYFLGIMGKTGLIKGAVKADAGAETLTFGELWTESLPYFWRMVGLSLLVGLPFFIIVVILVVVLFAGILGVVGAGDPGSGAVAGLLGALGIFVPAICCLSIASIIVGMIVEQAQNAIIIEDKGVLASLSRGWDVFKRNFLTVVLMAIILGVLGGIVGFVIAIPILLIVIPSVVGMVFLSDANSATAMVPLVIAGLCCLAYFPVLLVVSGIQQAYIQSVWTLTYLRLTAPAAIVPAAPPPSVEIADAQ
jgi:hypothetical protein